MGFLSPVKDWGYSLLEIMLLTFLVIKFFDWLYNTNRQMRKYDLQTEELDLPVIHKHPVEDKSLKELKEAIQGLRNYLRNIDKKVNIVFYGYVSCGKSSLINTFFDAMRDNTYEDNEWGISQQVAKVGHHNADCTQFHKRYDLTENICLWDIWGHRPPLDRTMTALVDGIVKPDDEGMVASIPRIELRNEAALARVPIDDKAHFIIFVFSAESSPVPRNYWQLYKDMQEILNARGDEVKHCVALTKLDVLDRALERKPGTAKDSVKVRKFIDELVEAGGVAPQDIYPIINRHNFKYQHRLALLDFWALELLRNAVEGSMHYRDRLEEASYEYDYGHEENNQFDELSTPYHGGFSGETGAHEPHNSPPKPHDVAREAMNHT